MHQTSTPIVARFVFTPERAGEFLEGELLATEQEYDSIEGVMEDLRMFGDAIADCHALVNGQVVNLSDHPDEA
jgi:hypothetical protein